MDTILGLDPITFWIIVTAALVNVSGALLGTFLVLRQMSMMGDAISHAVLPGLAIAFVVTGTREPIYMLIGALVAGVLTVILTQLIQRYTSVAEDAALGVVFTALFALGVLIISRVAHQVDLDPGCVLYGILEAAALDTTPVMGLEVPRIAITMGVATVVAAIAVTVFWKELKIASFDPGLATTLGINAQVVHYVLMCLVAAYTVAAFEAVGSILVVAALVAPAAAAYLLTDRLSWMVAYGCIIGVVSAVLAQNAALRYETSVAGMTAVVLGLAFALAVVFSPRYGFAAKKIQRFRLSMKVVMEDLLAMLYRWQEIYGNKPLAAQSAYEALGGGFAPRLARWSLLRSGEVRQVPGGLVLAEEGEKKAASLIRGHRLWETYLYTNFGTPEDHTHDPADRMEHFLTREILDEVAETLDYAKVDPQGNPIPANDKK